MTHRKANVALARCGALRDADFIAHARTDLPDAIKVLKSAADVLESVKIWLDAGHIGTPGKVERWLEEWNAPR